jgi:hypothetical protein
MSDESTSPSGETPSAPRPRLLDQVRETMRRKYMSRRTEEACIHWVRRFIYLHHKRHPSELSAKEVTAFLSHLAHGRDESTEV